VLSSATGPLWHLILMTSISVHGVVPILIVVWNNSNTGQWTVGLSFSSCIVLCYVILSSNFQSLLWLMNVAFRVSLSFSLVDVQLIILSWIPVRYPIILVFLIPNALALTKTFSLLSHWRSLLGFSPCFILLRVQFPFMVHPRQTHAFCLDLAFSQLHVKYFLNISSFLGKVSFIISSLSLPLREVRVMPGLMSAIIIIRVLVLGLDYM